MNAPLRTGAAMVAAALLAATAVVATYEITVARPARLVAVVDLADVYRREEARLAAQLTHAATDAERAHVLATAQTFAQRLPGALAALSRECGCAVFVRGALASAPPGTRDLTAPLQRALGQP